MNSTTLIGEIITGVHDDQLEEIIARCKVRLGDVATDAVADVKVGDTIVIQSCNPKYLIGLRATVTRRLPKNIEVEITEEHRARARRFGFGKIKLHPEHVKVI